MQVDWLVWDVQKTDFLHVSIFFDDPNKQGGGLYYNLGQSPNCKHVLMLLMISKCVSFQQISNILECLN